MLITRRSLFGIIAAPAIIRVADLMPVRAWADTGYAIAANDDWHLGSGDFTIEAYLKLSPMGEWTHVAVERHDGDLRSFKNHAPHGYDQNDPLLQPLRGITRETGIVLPSANSFNGLIDEVRITRGVARYSG